MIQSLSAEQEAIIRSAMKKVFYDEVLVGGENMREPVMIEWMQHVIDQVVVTANKAIIKSGAL